MSWGRWRIMLLGVVWISSVHAWTWHDGWQTRDQQAQTYFNTGDYAKAAEVFQRPDWRATATYRAQNYQQAAQLYAGVQTADGYYNAGNALAKMGQYQSAIAAYDQALQRDAHHADALFNKQIVEKMLKQQQQQQQQQQQKQKQQQEQSKQDPKQDQSKPNQSVDPSQSESEKPSQSRPKPEQEAKQPKSEPKQAKQAESSEKKESSRKQKPKANRSEREDQQAKEQWLRLIPDDPAYLLREKFMRDHLKRQQGSAS